MYTSNKRRRTDMLLGAAAAAAATAAQPPIAPAPPADGQRAPAAADCTDPRAELRRLALEVEPVVLPRASSAFPPAAAAAVPGGASPLSPDAAADPASSVIGYQPTYRAVLAKRGYLVRNTLGSGSYSKVRSTVRPSVGVIRVPCNPPARAYINWMYIPAGKFSTTFYRSEVL